MNYVGNNNETKETFIKIDEILTKIEEELDKKTIPQSITQALEYESIRMYMFYSLRIAKGKLKNDIRKDDVENIKNLKKYFDMVKENQNRKDNENDVELLNKIYGKYKN